MPFLALTSFLNCAACIGLGVLVWRQCPQRHVGRALASFDGALAFYCVFYGFWQMSHDPATALWNHKLLFLGVIWINQALLYFTFSILNRAKRPAYRAMLWASAAINVVYTILNFTNLLYTRVEPRFDLGYWPVPTVWGISYIGFWHLICFLSFGLLLHAGWKSYRNGARVYAEQIGYLVMAFGLGYFGGANNWPMWFGIHFPPYLNALVFCQPGIMAYAVVRHRLLNIEIIIKRTLVYSLVTGILAVVYVGMVTVVASVLQGWVSLSKEFSSGIAAAFVALLFHPARVRVQAFVDRKFFRVVVNARERLGEFTGHMMRLTRPDELAQSLFDTLEDAYHPTLLVLYLRYRDGKDFVRFTPSAGSILPGEMPSDNVWVRGLSQKSSTDQELFREMQRIMAVGVFPLINATGLSGYLFLGKRKSDLPYLEEDWRLIRLAVQEVAMAYEQMLHPVGALRPQTMAMLEDVSSGLIHEIKTPLANISLPAQATFADLSAVEQGKRRLEEILPKLKDRMQFILNQTARAEDRAEIMNDFAAVEDQRKESVDIGALLRDCLANAAVTLEQHQVTVHDEFSQAAKAVVMGQGKQLDIVFTNLIKNASEAMGSGRPQPSDRHLWVTLAAAGNHVMVKVRDSGPGMSPENQKHMFEKHFTTKGSAGTGIGLYFSQQIVRAHKGEMVCKSLENQGTEFTVSLPKAA